MKLNKLMMCVLLVLIATVSFISVFAAFTGGKVPTTRLQSFQNVSGTIILEVNITSAESIGNAINVTFQWWRHGDTEALYNSTIFNTTPEQNNFTNSSFNTSLLSDGIYNVTILISNGTTQARTDIYNRSIVNITIDNTVPNVTWVTPVSDRNYTNSSNNQTFNFSLYELTYPSTIVFMFDNASGGNINVTPTNQSGYWAASYNVSSLADGIHTVTIYVNDTLNNTNQTESIQFRVDNTIPNVTWNAPVNSSNYSRSTGNITFNASIGEVTPQTVVFMFDNGSGADINVTATNKSGYWDASYNVSTLAEGTSIVTVYVNDSTGRINQSQSIRITTDYTVPNVTMVTPSGNKNYSNTTGNGNVTFNMSVYDVNYPSYIFFMVDNASGKDFNATPINNSGFWVYQVNISTLTDGIHTVTAYVNDTANNINQSQSIEFRVDNVMPVVSWNAPSNRTNYTKNYTKSSSNVTFNVSISDVTPQTVYFMFNNGSGADINVTATNQSGFWTASYNVSTLTEGTNFVVLYINDSGNRINQTENITLFTDYGFPNVSINTVTGQSFANTNETNYTMNVSITDISTLVKDVVFSFDNSTGNGFNVTPSNISGEWYISINQTRFYTGNHTVRVFANDTSGNLNLTETVSFTVTDVTNTTITITFPLNQTNSSKKQFDLMVNLTENITLIYNLNEGDGNVTACTFCVGYHAIINVTNYEDYNLSVFAYDLAGNRVVASRNFTLVRDTDGDGLADMAETDKDNDQYADSIDTLNGNSSNVMALNIHNLTVTVNGSYNISQGWNASFTVNFTNGTYPYMTFTYNFSYLYNQTLDLANVTIERQPANGTSGYILVHGFNLTTGQTKTVFIDDIDSTKQRLCVKDVHITDIGEVSSDCTDSQEFSLQCPGTVGSYTCAREGGRFKVTGLTGSAVMQYNVTAAAATSSSTSSSSAGGGASGVCVSGYTKIGGICVKDAVTTEAVTEEEEEESEVVAPATQPEAGEEVEPETGGEALAGQAVSGKGLGEILVDLSWLWITIVVIAIIAVVGFFWYKKNY